jgi:hypothetical protein
MSLRIVSQSLLRLTLLSSVFAALPATAQSAEDEPADTAIVVTAQRLPGSVETDVPPDMVLDEAAVASYGASNVTDLLASLSTQTRTGRGRGGGMPVVLLNGRRVSGFAEIRDLPTEAIKRVETFPEEVALRFGYSADQRVVNFILKEGYKALAAEVEIGGPTSGGRATGQVELGWLAIGKKSRTNLNASYERGGSILESERGIIPTGVDLTRFRTLLPKSDELKLNSVITRTLSERTGATINLTLDRNNAASLFGAVTRPDGSLDPLARDRRTTNGAAGVTLDGNMGRWRWTGTARLNADWSRTLTDQLAGPGRDLAKSRLTTATTNVNMSGPLARLPGGPVMLSGTLGFNRLDFASQTVRLAGISSAKLGRSNTSARGSLDIPITSRRTGALAAIGSLSFNVNGGYQYLTDFGGLTSFGYGLTWSPVEGLTLTGSLSGEEAAPSLFQLRDPLIVSPGVTVFDFVRGESALVTQISGGNPLLRSEKQSDLKLGLSLEVPKVEGLSLSANYYRNRSTNPITSFPAITPAIQAAFPGRITRDAGGRLTSIDVRAINYLADQSEEIRWGINFAKSWGGPPGGGPSGFGGGRPGGGPPRGAGAGAGAGGRGGGFGFGPMGGGGKRLQVSLFHTIKLADTIQIAPGAAPLDLLRGDTIGNLGGTAQHKVELEGGYFTNGIGVRFNGAWDSGSTVRNALTPDLHFGDLMTLNARLFVNFDQRKGAVKKMPFLKGSRIVFRVNNITGAIRTVRDASGATPLRYQRGYLDPLGRVVEVSFRKTF